MEEFKEMTYHTLHERNKVLKQIEVIGAQLTRRERTYGMKKLTRQVLR